MAAIPSFKAENNLLQDKELEDLAEAARNVIEGLDTLLAYWRARDELILSLQPSNSEIGLRDTTAIALGFTDAADCVDKLTQAMNGAIDIYNMESELDLIRALL